MVPVHGVIGLCDKVMIEQRMNEENLVYRLRKRAEIRRQIPTRKSVQEGQPDRIADLLEEAADEIEKLRNERSKIDQLDVAIAM